MANMMSAVAAVLLATALMATAHAEEAHKHSAAADAVTRLADQFVAEYERRFPFTAMQAGVRLTDQAGINSNAARDIARWRQLVREMEHGLARIPESAVAGQPAWVTRAYLQQAITKERGDEICRSELWKISPYEWPYQLAIIARMQPVTNDQDRHAALQRWEGLAGWIDRDADNLAQGLKLGYSGLKGAVEAEIRQIDTFIAAPLEQWPTNELARRSTDEEFSRRLNEIATQQLLPAAKRYRDFLQNQYLPRARTNPSITSQPNGAHCLRARLSVSTTVDMDPRVMFATLTARRKGEHAYLLNLGRQIYNQPALEWNELTQKVLHDRRNSFRDAEEIHFTLEAILKRARAALPRMVVNPPPGNIALRPFPEYTEATAPLGRFTPASADGAQPATFDYRANAARFARVTAESLTLHETIPGHYLQTTLKNNSAIHPIAQLIYVGGPSEGWATYAETWAQELGLYSSAFQELGGYLNSMTPSAVADLGMQVMGWDIDEAAAYLHSEIPFFSPARARETANGLASDPGSVESYPVGVLQFEAMRKRAQSPHWDSRQFHQMLLEDGALPFPALNAKVDRWIKSQSHPERTTPAS